MQEKYEEKRALTVISDGFSHSFFRLGKLLHGVILV